MVQTSILSISGASYETRELPYFGGPRAQAMIAGTRLDHAAIRAAAEAHARWCQKYGYEMPWRKLLALGLRDARKIAFTELAAVRSVAVEAARWSAMSPAEQAVEEAKSAFLAACCIDSWKDAEPRVAAALARLMEAEAALKKEKGI